MTEKTISRAAFPMTLAFLLAFMTGCEAKHRSQIVSLSPTYDSLHAQGEQLWQPIAAAASLEPDDMTSYMVAHEGDIRELNRILTEMANLALHIADSLRADHEINVLMTLQARHHKLEIARNDAVLRLSKLWQSCRPGCRTEILAAGALIKSLDQQIVQLDSVMEKGYGR